MATKISETTGGAENSTYPSYSAPRLSPLHSRASIRTATLSLPPASDLAPSGKIVRGGFSNSVGHSPAAIVPATTKHTAQQAIPDQREAETIEHPGRRPPLAETNPDESLRPTATQISNALVGSLTEECRRYDDLRRARQRLDLQIKSMCRRACDGDKVAGMKMASKIAKDPPLWFVPYFLAQEPLDTAITDQEKVIKKLARQLPVWKWVESIGGVSDRFLGLIVGECAAPIGDYKSVSAVWKRMGLAVIDGGRQRRVTGDAAIIHGYVARRRALMWNIGESMIKAQIRNPKGQDGKPIGEAVAIGPYGQVYLDRKAYEANRVERPIIAHARAKRYMEKRMLRDLFAAWRRAEGNVE